MLRLSGLLRLFNSFPAVKSSDVANSRVIGVKGTQHFERGRAGEVQVLLGGSDCSGSKEPCTASRGKVKTRLISSNRAVQAPG